MLLEYLKDEWMRREVIHVLLNFTAPGLAALPAVAKKRGLALALCCTILYVFIGYIEM